MGSEVFCHGIELAQAGKESKLTRRQAMYKAILFLCFVSLLCLGCDSEPSITTNSLEELQGAMGILEGRVTIGPICPVEGPGMDCDPDPELFTSHRLVIRTPAGVFVQDVSIDGEGNYRTELPAGTYLVDFAPRDIGIPGGFSPLEAVIVAGATTRLDIDIDTGIR